MIDLPLAAHLAATDAAGLLGTLQRGDGHTLRAAAEEVDAAGPLGLTVAFKEVVLHTTSEGVRGTLFGESGEIYVVTTALDGSGRAMEYQTRHFPGIERGARLPLGEGGLLAAYIENPRWFVDVHMLVMESDGDVRRLGAFIEEARGEAGLDGDATRADRFDPSGIARLAAGVDRFLTVLTHLLKANGDDHIATVHDFYLKHQAFGQGRHPAAGLTAYQGISAAYQLDLVQI